MKNITEHDARYLLKKMQHRRNLSSMSGYNTYRLILQIRSRRKVVIENHLDFKSKLKNSKMITLS